MRGRVEDHERDLYRVAAPFAVAQRFVHYPADCFGNISASVRALGVDLALHGRDVVGKIVQLGDVIVALIAVEISRVVSIFCTDLFRDRAEFALQKEHFVAHRAGSVNYEHYFRLFVKLIAA